MSGCPPIPFDGIDDLLYARLLQEAVRGGAKFDQQNEQLVRYRGMEFTFVHSGTTLEITCTKPRFFVRCETIAQKLTELVKAAQEADQ